jgi:NAD(P)-dependent dehydrogenase (short-subunit alcohol dehydrogenase family)
MNSCSHPHVLVTGASSGIGRATALRLAVSGYHVFAGVRRPADGRALCQGAGREITPLLLDVTNGGQISDAADVVAGHVGGAGLDGLVNNAGIGVFGPLEIIPVEQFRTLMEVNVTGQLAVTQAFLPLLRQARGRIIMIGSIGTRFTPPFVGALAASKSALASMDEALRQELAPWGIRVVLVEPATVRSEAVGKLERDAARLMSQASPAQRDLYEEAFGHLVDTFAARHRHGSPARTRGGWPSWPRRCPPRRSTRSAASWATSPHRGHAWTPRNPPRPPSQPCGDHRRPARAE